MRAVRCTSLWAHLSPARRYPRALAAHQGPTLARAISPQGCPALGSDPMVSCVPPGQFLSRDARLTAEPSGPPSPKAGEPAETVLKVRGHQVPVVWKQRKIYNGEEQVDCWFARSNAAKLIDGEYRDYLASHPFDAQTSFGPRPSGRL